MGVQSAQMPGQGAASTARVGYLGISTSGVMFYATTRNKMCKLRPGGPPLGIFTVDCANLKTIMA
jgi:hypothetical protein